VSAAIAVAVTGGAAQISVSRYCAKWLGRENVGSRDEASAMKLLSSDADIWRHDAALNDESGARKK